MKRSKPRLTKAPSSVHCGEDMGYRKPSRHEPRHEPGALGMGGCAKVGLLFPSRPESVSVEVCNPYSCMYILYALTILPSWCLASPDCVRGKVAMRTHSTPTPTLSGFCSGCLGRVNLSWHLGSFIISFLFGGLCHVTPCDDRRKRATCQQTKAIIAVFSLLLGKTQVHFRT